MGVLGHTPGDPEIYGGKRVRYCYLFIYCFFSGRDLEINRKLHSLNNSIQLCKPISGHSYLVLPVVHQYRYLFVMKL